MSGDLQLSLDAKRLLAEELLRRRREDKQSPVPGSIGSATTERVGSSYLDLSYDMFVQAPGLEQTEISGFNAWVDAAKADGLYGFESPRLRTTGTETEILRETGERLTMLNFASYNYLGYGHHPAVIAAAKAALDRYGLGAASAPIISGTFGLHQEFQERLVNFIGLPDYGATLFTSGYSVNLGTISAYAKPGSYLVLDQSAHVSLREGATLAHARALYFRHNDVAHLEEVLRGIARGSTRILVCAEGVYSADGDYAHLADIVGVAKRYGAQVLIDEAHSMLVAGPTGRGVAEAQRVLGDVDLIVITFSKAFCGVGGALVARKDITQYVNWYARCRAFSCSLDPAVTGGINKALELASGPDGTARRERLWANAAHLRGLLAGHVNIGNSQSWVVPVIFGADRMSLPINNFLQRAGLDTGVMQYPATPKNQARIRLFVTSEHEPEQIEQAASIILRAAAEFGFLQA
jgi:glycine C-acetyltransferase